MARFGRTKKPGLLPVRALAFGAHLDVDVDKAMVYNRHAGLVGSDLLAHWVSGP